MCDGEFMNLPPNEAESHFEYVSETTQSWDTSDPNNRNSKVRLGPNSNVNPNLPRQGLHQIKNEDDLCYWNYLNRNEN